MWYKFSQNWTNQNTSSQPTPYSGGSLANNPNRQVWQDQNYVYFIDDAGATRSMQKNGPNGQENPQIQQIFNKPLNQIQQHSNHSTKNHPGHHDNYGPYNHSQQNSVPHQMTPFQKNVQDTMQQLMSNPFGVQQQGNATVLSDPLGQALEKFFPGGKLPQQPGLSNFIPKAKDFVPGNLPTVTDTGRQTVRM
jgi:hypothetical protein